jgi:raffinose/stachyose/melibiose transport system substrate-binding protein
MAEDSSDKMSWKSAAGMVLLAAAIIASIVGVYRNEQKLTGKPGETVLRLCHWQLEDGFRNALQAVIDDYQEMKAAKGERVRIVQMPITEKVYSQWLNTQLISGSAPDLIEAGQTKLAYEDEPSVRYFIPVSSIISKPNPYNAGTDLETVPWRETALDGMRSGYRPKLVDYYAIPASLVGTRVFVNQTLLKEVTGSEEPPTSFEELVKVDEQTVAFASKNSRQLRTMASCYQLAYFYGRYQVAFTAALEPLLDTNLDGTILPMESYVGILKDQVSFQSPRIKAYYECVDRLGQMMGADKSAIDRQTAQFMFVQGRAMFLGTGSWDAEGLRTEFDKKGWKLGVIDFLIPRPGEKWSEFVSGRAAEPSQQGGFPLAIFKGSQHSGAAIDFLQYLTSRKPNEKFNSLASWPPVTVGAQPNELMKPFVPDPKGYLSKFVFELGSDVTSKVDQEQTPFFNHEQSYDTMAANIMNQIRSTTAGGDRVWATIYSNTWRDSRAQERVLAVQAAQMLLDPANAAAAEKRYNRAMIQQVRKNNGGEERRRFEDIRGYPIPKIQT